MNTTANYKYIEWRNTPGLHEDTLNTISELRFLRDELHFLKDLVAEHTLELIYGRSHEEAVGIGSELQGFDNGSKQLLQDLIVHSNNLQLLTDDVDIPNELQDYKDRHYNLMMEAIDLQTDLKKCKRGIFKMMTAIMKKSKQKKLPPHYSKNAKV